MATTQTKRKTAQGGGSEARKKSTGRKGPAGRASKQSASKSPSKAQSRSHTRSQAHARADDMHVQMHTAHAELPIPYLTPRDITANAQAIGSRLPGLSLPPPKRLAFYGGLGVLAVAGAVDWPVAVAIGAATAVARSKGD